MAVEVEGSSDSDLGHAVGRADGICVGSYGLFVVWLGCQSLLVWGHVVYWSPFSVGQRAATIGFVSLRLFGRFVLILCVI